MTARESFARIHRVMAILHAHPNGLPLDTVAAELGVSEKQLRTEILEYYATDIPPQLLLGLHRADTIEFLAADGAEADPHLAPVIRAVSDRPEAELGVEYLRADDLVALYEAARSLAELEPYNEALADAVAVLRNTFLAGPTLAATGTDAAAGTAAILRDAVSSRRAVRIEYSRAWRPGVTSRVIHPYALHRTARGWEVDAGPMAQGRARTFLVERIASAALVDETFEPPPGIAEILAVERSQTQVEMSLPQRTQWVVDRFAESTVVQTSDADDLTVRAGFLPPVAERVGLILLIAGPDAFVVDPPQFDEAGSDLARALLAHHGLS